MQSFMPINMMFKLKKNIICRFNEKTGIYHDVILHVWSCNSIIFFVEIAKVKHSVLCL